MEKKICSKCRVEKEFCEFHKMSKSKSGVKSICKECRKLEKSKNAEYHLINKEKIESAIAHFLLILGIVLFLSIPLWVWTL